MPGRDDPDPKPNRTVFQPSPLQQLRSGGETMAPGLGQTPSPEPFEPVGRPTPRAPDDMPKAPSGQDLRNPLAVEAAQLLALLAAMRSGRARMALPDLHRQAGDDIEAFRNRFRAQLSEEELRRATYALAATADDIALNLPLDEADIAEWAQRSLVVRFFHEAIGGDRFWRLLDEMLARPASYANLLELYHACMGAGFEGRYRVIPGGNTQHQDLMQRVLQALEHPRNLSRVELSPAWRGEDVAPATVDVWTRVIVIAAVSAGLLLVTYLVLHFWLASARAPAEKALQALVPGTPLSLSREPTPAPVTTSEGDSIRKRLASRIQAGEVEVVDDPNDIRVRTKVPGLFASGSDKLDARYAGLFQEVASALNAQAGDIEVDGYTDSDAPHNIVFTDNDELSKARAQTAAEIVKRALTDPSRKVTAQGFGDQQAIVENTTPENKGRNRRVEVVVQRSGQ